MSKFRTVIVCESTETGTDKRLIETLIAEHSLLPNDSFTTVTRCPGDIQTVKDFLKYTLPKQTYIVSRETINILVIVDADEKPKDRFQEIKQCFNKQIFAVQQSMEARLSKDKTRINVGIYLFPNNTRKGSLETFGLKVLKHSRLMSKLKCIDSYILCLGDKDGRITTNNKSKAKFRIFMATPYPDRYVSSIIDSIDFNSSEFEKLKEFIKQAE